MDLNIPLYRIPLIIFFVFMVFFILGDENLFVRFIIAMSALGSAVVLWIDQ